MAPPSVTVDYQAPDADLAEIISSLYLLRIDGAAFDEPHYADRPQIRFMLAGTGEYVFADGRRCPAHRATILGPTSGPVRAVGGGPVRLFGWGLLPGGWSALMEANGDKYTNMGMDAEILLGAAVGPIIASLDEASDFTAMCAIGQDLMRALLVDRHVPALWFIRAVDRWLAGSVSPQLPELVADTGLTLRTLERMTKRHYGMPPKLLARKYRAVRAAAALARGEELDDSGLGLAFYDQSHLIREMKQFTGLTPGQLSRPGPISRATSRARRSLSGQVAPIVAET